MLTPAEIDILILCLRQKLDQVTDEIVALEWRAKARRSGKAGAPGVIRGLSPFTTQAENWSRHCRRAGS